MKFKNIVSQIVAFMLSDHVDAKGLYISQGVGSSCVILTTSLDNLTL